MDGELKMNRQRVSRWLGCGLALLLVAGCAVYVWPTAYRDIPVRATTTGYLHGRVFAARQHRFTGAVEFLTEHGWQATAP
jgi:hypothetical protein